MIWIQEIKAENAGNTQVSGSTRRERNKVNASDQRPFIRIGKSQKLNMLKAAKNRSLHSTRILASVFGGLCCFKQSSIPVYRTGPWVSSGFIAAFKTQELISHFSRIFLLSLLLVILYFIFPFLFPNAPFVAYKSFSLSFNSTSHTGVIQSFLASTISLFFINFLLLPISAT